MKSSILILFALLVSASALGEEKSQAKVDSVLIASPRRENPLFGLELSGSPTGMGDRSVSTGSPANYNVIPISAQLDLLPIHKFGVWSVGGTLDYYFVSNSDGTSNYIPSYAFMAGGQAKYQARFMDNQFIVPVAGYTVGSWSYKNNNGGAGYFLVKGPTLGAWIYLNGLDQSSTASAWNDLGIRRTYVILEMRRLDGSDDTATVAGQTYHLGIRFEI